MIIEKFKNRKGTKIFIEKDDLGKFMVYVYTSRPKRDFAIFYPDSSSVLESLYDLLDCINILRFDKIGRRWFRSRALRFMLNGKTVINYLDKNGEINFTKI